MTRNYEHLFKLLLIGDGGVGKSSLLLRFADNDFSGNYIPTIAFDYKIKTILINGEGVNLQIWDTAGQERLRPTLRSITSTYYKNTDGVIVVYDVTGRKSFENVKRWLHESDQNCNCANRILVGNKDDKSDPKMVSTEEAQRYASQMGIEFFETSAKTTKNVEEIFNAVITQRNIFCCFPDQCYQL